FAWSPRGGAIAVADGGRIALVSLDGRVRTLFRSEHDDALTNVRWAPAVRGVRLRPAQPIPPLVEATATALRSHYAISLLTAIGLRVGAIYVAARGRGASAPAGTACAARTRRSKRGLSTASTRAACRCRSRLRRVRISPSRSTDRGSWAAAI